MKRLPFSTSVRKEMKIERGKARCHTISWENISNNLTELSELYLGKLINEEIYWCEMVKLWYAITGLMKPSKEYVKNIKCFLDGTGDRQELLNALGRELNSCIDNLRLGYHGTNSSIQGGLDIPIQFMSSQLITLRAGTPYTTEWLDPQNGFTNRNILKNDEKILLIKDLPFIKRLIALLSMNTSVEPYIYTTKDRIQSSDYQNGYSVQSEHSFRKFRAPFSGKAVHTFPDQSAVIHRLVLGWNLNFMCC